MTDITRRYRQAMKAGHLRADPAQLDAIAAFQPIADALARPAPRGLFRKRGAAIPGLYLWGGVGRGKSMLMDLFVASLTIPRRRVHFHAFMQETHAAMHRARADGVEDALAPFVAAVAGDVRLLAFDEMQITDIADAMIVGRLFQGLIDHAVTIVTTSNRPPDDLYLDGLNRGLFLPFIAMLKERMVIHELAGGTDFRQDLLTGARSYFAPVTRQARAAIAAIWRDMAGDDAPPLRLRVQGREVVLPAFRDGAARASFYDLCGKALGPADYLAIASAVRVLLLEDIPRLGRANFNEARRFVTLIDALYEARVRLIASAQAEPEMLYLEGEGSFEFARTASRLREMQAADWGQ